MISIEDRQLAFSIALKEHSLPFHWKMGRLPCDCYNGRSYVHKSMLICTLSETFGYNIFDLFCEHEKEMMFCEDSGSIEMAMDFYSDSQTLSSFIENFVPYIKDVHAHDEMVSFYDIDILDSEGVIIRSARLQ